MFLYILLMLMCYGVKCCKVLLREEKYLILS